MQFVPRIGTPHTHREGLYNRVETQPGLDGFVGNSAGLRDRSLGPLLAWARAVIPGAHERRRTPLFLLATAGLRKLPERDREALLEAARGVMKASGFRWGRYSGGDDIFTLVWGTFCLGI